jgi:hypothetical protein
LQEQGEDDMLPKSEQVSSLALAAGHMAEANKTLYQGPQEIETAIAHLDAALDCLKQCGSKS